MNTKEVSEPRVIQYLYYIHLALFVIAISLSIFEGQSFQISWGIHIVVSYIIVILQKGYDKGLFYSKLVYLLSIPTFYMYQIISDSSEYEIPIATWVLNLGYIGCLYLIIPFLVRRKDLYIKVKSNA